MATTIDGPPPHPRVISYTDGDGIDREIFVPPGRYEEAMSLCEKEDWKKLSTEFSPFSDVPQTS
jgi:hypothetical protein